MAAAEARAVWQRTANRYFIQEDAKRAPKLASISSIISNIETKPIDPADLDDSFPLPNETSFYSNASSDSKWLQLQPDYMYQRGLTSEQVNLLDPRNPHQFVENPDDSSISSVSSVSSKESYELVQMDSVELPWWQVAEKNDFHGPMHSGLEPQKVNYGQPDTSKTKILEALCHSQTRARKAEVEAKKAYAEKEHAIKVVFRQASELFAYRQWVYLLQVENLCYQNKNNKNDQMFGKLDKNLKVVSAKGKRKRTKHGFGRYGDNLGKYAVVFVFGLGIVGAGLILGWTIGWMLI